MSKKKVVLLIFEHDKTDCFDLHYIHESTCLSLDFYLSNRREREVIAVGEPPIRATSHCFLTHLSLFQENPLPI